MFEGLPFVNCCCQGHQLLDVCLHKLLLMLSVGQGPRQRCQGGSTASVSAAVVAVAAAVCLDGAVHLKKEAVQDLCGVFTVQRRVAKIANLNEKWSE